MAKLQGFEEVGRRLKEIDAGFGKKAVRRVLRNAAKYLRIILVNAAPRRTGHLVSLLKVRAGKAQKGRIRMNVSMMNAGGRWYAPFVEWGKNTKGGKKIEGQRWGSQAFEAEEAAVSRMIVADLTDELDKYAKGQGGQS